MCSLCLLLLFCAVAVDSFWLSQNRLAWNDSQTYCKNKCGTDLAIINNASEWRTVNELIGNESVIMGGFSSSPYQDSQHVWIDNPPCARFPEDENAAYGTVNCSFKYRFLCDSCEGVLEKYILYSRAEEGDNVHNQCFAHLNTTGASIHSEDDMNSVSSLCYAPNTNVEDSGAHYPCWVGLKKENNEDPFRWTDGTFFNYGSDMSGGQFPWGGGEPSNVSGGGEVENCVQIRGESKKSMDWNDKRCWAELPQFICNKPNEFCYADRWQSMYLDHDRSAQDGRFYNCTFAASGDSMAVISNKKWNGRNWPLQIEYVFAANYSRSDSERPSGFGIVILYENTCNYSFIGLSLDHHTDEVLIKVEHDSQIQTHTIMESVSSFDQDRFHQMNIDFRWLQQNPNSVALVANITFDHTFHRLFSIEIASQLIYSDIFDSPKYIAVMNRNAAVTGKSLFISGTPDYSDTHLLTACINKYTAGPTSNPTHATSSPSLAPTISPTVSPTFQPTFEPTFEPTNVPTLEPTNVPSFAPTRVPTGSPSLYPSFISTLLSGPTEPFSASVASATTLVESTSDDSDSPQSASDIGVMLYILLGILGCVVCVLVAGWYMMRERDAPEASKLRIDRRLSPNKRQVRIVVAEYLPPETDEVELAAEPGRNVILASNSQIPDVVDDTQEESQDSDNDNTGQPTAGTTKGATTGGNESEDSESSQSSDLLGERGGNDTHENDINRENDKDEGKNNALLNHDEPDSLDDNEFTMG